MPKSYQFKYETTRKVEQTLTKFHYYLEDVFPNTFQSSTPSSLLENSNSFQSARGSKDLLYFYANQRAKGQFVFNQHSILETAKKVYLEKSTFENQIIKINDNSFQRVSQIRASLLPLSRKVKEIITFYIQKQNVTKKKYGSEQVLQLYIIHHCNDQKHSSNENLIWLNFVQRYTLNKNGIKYDLVASIKDQKTLLWKNTNTSLFQDVLKQNSSEQMFNKFQGILLQYESQIKQEIKHKNDPAFRQQHKLRRKIPTQFLKQFYQLKKKFPSEKQNTICRFFIAKQFNFEKANSSISQYVQWKNDVKAKYKWQDFQDLHKREIFVYLGQDFMGRPVVLNNAKNVKVNEIDHQLYCIYYTYYLQIYLQEKMRGDVSQVLIIADSSDVGSQHFKLAITKRNITDCLKYSPQRQYKLIALNPGKFVYYCWKFIKPLIPKRTCSKIQIPDQKQVLEVLKQQMDINTIPSYLGGINTIC